MKNMAFYHGIRFLLIVSLCTSCFAKPSAHVNNETSAAPQSASARRAPDASATARSSSTNSDLSENEKEGRAINFALDEINNSTTLRYKERVDEVLQVKQNRRYADLYHLKLRLARTDCRKRNLTCDVSYDPSFAKKATYNPFTAPLEPLKPGRVIFVEGGIPLKSKGFDVTIQTGVERSVAAQLRISARFSDEGNVVLLKHFDGCWNLDKHYQDILQTTTNFTISITCLSTHFEVAINDHILDKFHHIVPYVDATHLSIQGEVDINEVTGIEEPLPVKDYAKLPAWMMDDVKYQIPSYVPFTAPLDMPLRPGKIIKIKGRIHALAKMFSVYIQSGTNESAPEAVQLRLQSKFDASDKKVHLEYYDGTWNGLETYDHTMVAGHSFKMVITCLSKQFKISIDGKDLASYDHKIPYEKATHLRISGRVNITEVTGIDKIPAIHTFDPPALAHPLPPLPLHDLPLTLGRKIKVWGTIPGNSTSFEIRLRDIEDTIHPLKVSFKLTDSKWYLNIRNHHQSTDGTLQSHQVDWIKAGDLIQFEIEYAQPNFHIRFFDDWEYNYISTQVPMSNVTEVSLYGTLLVHGISGLRNGPDPPSTRHSPTRVCDLNVWSRSQLRDMWLNGLKCEN